MNELEVETAASPSNPQGVLLSCEDIYRASGILSPHAKYSITKIAEMLGNAHIRDLSKEVKRASMLMALDAAGTPVDEVLQDATRRQHALDIYEAGQQKLFEEFEATKSRENAHIQAELERVTAHYTDRIKQNNEQVLREKNALLTWQTMKQQESQRIAEAVVLCGKQPGVEAPGGLLLSPGPRASAASV